jgi:hypothetical protein
MGPDNGVENGAENGFENGLDNGFDIQDVGMIAGFLCTEEEAEEEAKKLKSPEDDMDDIMDASAIGMDMADIGLDMSSFEEDEEEE